MERIALSRSRQTVHILIDNTCFRDSAHPLHMGQCSIVRCHYVLSRGGLRHNASSRRSHSRIHNADKYRALRPVVYRLYQPVGCFPDIILGNIVCQVRNPKFRVYPIGYSIHRADSSVRSAKICLNNKWFSHIHLSFSAKGVV